MAAQALATHDKYVISADRDEKIRVSRYPDAFDIVSYCLGHVQFVTQLHLPATAPHLLLSGGGDGLVIVWDYVAGRSVHTVDLVQTGSLAAVWAARTPRAPGRLGEGER